MKKVLRWTGIGLGSLLGIVVVVAGALFLIGGSRLNRSYDIEAAAIAIPTNEEAIVRGRHLAEAVTPYVRPATATTWRAKSFSTNRPHKR